MVLLLTWLSSWPLGANAEEYQASALVEKAKLMVFQADAERHRVCGVHAYDEPLKLLEKVTRAYADSKEANIEAERLRVLCYDRQARYVEKRQALTRYADLLADGDEEAASRVIKAQADDLVAQGETGEAIVVYRLVAKTRPEVRTLLEPVCCA